MALLATHIRTPCERHFLWATETNSA